jgi:hypothetical protein
VCGLVDLRSPQHFALNSGPRQAGERRGDMATERENRAVGRDIAGLSPFWRSGRPSRFPSARRRDLVVNLATDESGVADEQKRCKGSVNLRHSGEH